MTVIDDLTATKEINISEDLKITLNKISKGRGISPSSNFTSNLLKIGITPQCNISLISINKNARCVSVKINGKQKKIEILTEKEFIVANKARLIPPEKWFKDMNNKIKLQNKLKENVIKAKTKLTKVNEKLALDDYT